MSRILPRILLSPALLAALVLPACGENAFQGPGTGECGELSNCVGPLPGSWASRAALRTPRQEGAAAALGGKVWYAGGIESGGQVSTRVEVYDPATNAWTDGPALPQPRHHLALVAAGGKLHAIGGYSAIPFDAAKATVWSLDPAEGVWRPGAPLPSGRAAMATAEVGGKVYLFGGMNAAGTPTDGTLVFDVAAGTWTAGRAMPTAREHVAAAAIGGIVYVAAGRVPSSGGLGNRTTLEAYDPATDTWTARAPLSVARSGHGAAALGGRLYVFGGEVPGGVLSSVEEYDPSANAWRPIAPLAQGRTGAGAVPLANTVLLVGGAGESGLSGASAAFTAP